MDDYSHGMVIKVDDENYDIKEEFADTLSLSSKELAENKIEMDHYNHGIVIKVDEDSGVIKEEFPETMVKKIKPNIIANSTDVSCPTTHNNPLQTTNEDAYKLEEEDELEIKIEYEQSEWQPIYENVYKLEKEGDRLRIKIENEEENGQLEWQQKSIDGNEHKHNEGDKLKIKIENEEENEQLEWPQKSIDENEHNFEETSVEVEVDKVHGNIIERMPQHITQSHGAHSTIQQNLSSKSNNILLKHTHNGEKSHKCDVCPISFSYLSQLFNHKRVHTGEKPYKCNGCLKSFSQKFNLTQHERVVHTGLKPYKCDNCLKFFSLKSNLNVHKRLHTGEKPYKCNVCLKDFSQLTALSSHKCVHTGK